MRHIGRYPKSLGALAAAGWLAACSSEKPVANDEVSQTEMALVDQTVPCDARANAVTANTGNVMVNSGSRVDSYQSSLGPYGGSNIGQKGSVRAATSITVNGSGVISGDRIQNSPAHLSVVPVPSTARKLPLGSATPGNVNINTAAESVTLAPGAYVVANLNVNYPGAINISPKGAVQIWVTGTLNLGGKENLNGVPSNLTFLVQSAGYVNVNSNGQLFGTIYAPTSTVNLNSVVFGSVVGASVTLNSGAAVHFDQNSTCACGTVDTDQDGTPDCADGCPLDPNKIDPGVCGCFKSEADDDHDKTPNCRDACPNDPTKTEPGDCGCAGDYALSGTPCTDGITAGNFVCNGAGVCGNPESSSPEPGKCIWTRFERSFYWICHSTKSWEEARTLCAAIPYQSLANIGSRTENAFLRQYVTTPAWIGANAKSVATTWRWADGTNPDGSVFFSNGANVVGGFSRWASGKPGDAVGRCGAMQADGTWIDQPCTQTLTTYICEKPRPLTPTIPPPPNCGDFALNCPPPKTPSGPCVPAESIGMTTDEFRDGANACVNGCTEVGAPGCAACTGPFAPAPEDSTCSPLNTQACGITPVQPEVPCQDDSECASGLKCRAYFDCSHCDPSNPDDQCDQDCPGRKLCGTLVPGCDDSTDPNERCEETEICPDPNSTGNSDPLNDPGTNLGPTAFGPGDFGTPPPPVTSYVPEPACSEAVCNKGKYNGWCSYEVADTLEQKHAKTEKHGQSGGGSLVEFQFDPNLAIDFDATPKGLGELDFNLSAMAQLKADALFDLPYLGQHSFTVFNSEDWVRADPCRIWTTDSKLQLFTKDLLPAKMKYDLEQASPAFTETCRATVQEFQNKLDRAYKALKDAQELITQYNALKAAGKRFPANFCQTVAGSPAAGFPPGNCATETPEATINRFITFYEQQADAVQATMRTLIGLIPPAPVNISNNTQDRKEQKLYSTTFPIGPIPVRLEVQAFAEYGIKGSLDFVVNPGAVLSGGDREDLIKIAGNLNPWVSTGVTLFVGVGFDIGVASAKAGVEGTLTLGRLSAPLLAGAGIQVQVEDDPRLLPPDLAGITTATPKIPSKQFRFFATYDYGSTITLSEILHGSLGAKVKISFLFWSKTWRKTFVNFPDVIAPKTLNLVSGDGVSNNGASGYAPWGLVQMPWPFVTFTRLTPATPSPSAPQVAFDTSKVEKLFYDHQCKCNSLGVECVTPLDCCPIEGSSTLPICFPEPASGKTICSTCRKSGSLGHPAESCNTVDDCCPDNCPGSIPQCAAPIGQTVKVCGCIIP